MVLDQLSSCPEVDATTSSDNQVPSAELIDALIKVFDDAWLSKAEVMGRSDNPTCCFGC